MFVTASTVAGLRKAHASRTTRSTSPSSDRSAATATTRTQTLSNLAAYVTDLARKGAAG